MKTGRPTIYWDACVFIAWIQNENRSHNEMDGANDIANKINNNQLILLTSTLTKTEILQSKLDDDAGQRFENLFKRKNCQLVLVDDRISTKASEIRDYYQIQKQVDGLPTLKTPDAIHLATAIIHQVDEFHTFDERNRPKRRALLPLNGNVAGYPLTICKPPLPTQVVLF